MPTMRLKPNMCLPPARGRTNAGLSDPAPRESTFAELRGKLLDSGEALRYARQAKGEPSCKGDDIDFWVRTGKGEIPKADLARAKGICGDCPIQEECFEYATETRTPKFVWSRSVSGFWGSYYFPARDGEPREL